MVFIFYSNESSKTVMEVVVAQMYFNIFLRVYSEC